MQTTPNAIEAAFAAIAHAARKLHPDEEHRERAAKLRTDLYFASDADRQWLAAYSARERARMAVQMVVRGLCYSTRQDVEALTRIALRNPDAPEVARLKLHDAAARFKLASAHMVEADRAR